MTGSAERGTGGRGSQQERHLKTHLRDLTDAVTTALASLDVEMAKPESVERGKRIAAVANNLDLANDRARYFALGVDFRTDDKRARRA